MSTPLAKSSTSERNRRMCEDQEAEMQLWKIREKIRCQRYGYRFICYVPGSKYAESIDIGDKLLKEALGDE